MIKAIKKPLAGLILRMFNLPTGTILINVWIKVRRLRLYLLYLHYPQSVVFASNWIGFNTASP